jgi:Lhr-like helicase
MIAYTNLYEINVLQQTIIKYILYWVQTQKIPIPQSKIVEEMVRNGKNRRTVIHSLDGLLRLDIFERQLLMEAVKVGFILIRSNMY